MFVLQEKLTLPFLLILSVNAGVLFSMLFQVFRKTKPQVISHRKNKIIRCFRSNISLPKSTTSLFPYLLLMKLGTYQLKAPIHLTFILFPYPHIFPVKRTLICIYNLSLKLTIIYRASFRLLSPK